MTPPLEYLRELAGPAAVTTAADGTPTVRPPTLEAAAALLRSADAASWRVRLEGAGSWMPADAPADLAISAAGLDRVEQVEADDLVATVGAGVAMGDLRAALAARGTWVALDPPGRPGRTLGSVLATGTAGPLRTGFGGVRDHVLGLTLLTGDGRVVEVGGRVVKNVAGYDLTRLQVGAFGAFGLLARVHLRLRAVPRADRTLVATGERDRLTEAGRDLQAAGLTPAAAELLSPAWAGEREWTLAVRLLGTPAAVEAEAGRLTAAASAVTWREPAPTAGESFWDLVARAPLGPVCLRLGALMDGLDDALDLVAAECDEEFLAASVTQGSIRWAGTLDAPRLRHLRARAAEREIPITLERAPWSVRHGAGLFGAYREGVGQLVSRLRHTFDPGDRLVVPHEAAPDA